MQSPYTFQTAVSVERQLPMRTTLSLSYVSSRTNHVLRIRNVNAPVCPLQVNCLNAPRPDPTRGDVYMYESSGRSNQNQIMVNFRSTYSQRLSFFGFYRLGFAKSDTDGAGSFPAYSYDLTDEYGRSSFDQRHSFTVGGSITLPWRVSLNPFVSWNAGRPFNITRGVDLNGDGLFTERPTLANSAHGVQRSASRHPIATFRVRMPTRSFREIGDNRLISFGQSPGRQDFQLWQISQHAGRGWW